MEERASDSESAGRVEVRCRVKDSFGTGDVGVHTSGSTDGGLAVFESSTEHEVSDTIDHLVDAAASPSLASERGEDEFAAERPEVRLLSASTSHFWVHSIVEDVIKEPSVVFLVQISYRLFTNSVSVANENPFRVLLNFLSDAIRHLLESPLNLILEHGFCRFKASAHPSRRDEGGHLRTPKDNICGDFRDAKTASLTAHRTSHVSTCYQAKKVVAFGIAEADVVLPFARARFTRGKGIRPWPVSWSRLCLDAGWVFYSFSYHVLFLAVCNNIVITTWTSRRAS